MSLIAHPSICCVSSSEAVLERERLPMPQRLLKPPKAGRSMIDVDAVGPALAQLLRECPAGEREPRVADEDALAISVSDPQHDGTVIDESAKERIRGHQFEKAWVRHR